MTTYSCCNVIYVCHYYDHDSAIKNSPLPHLLVYAPHLPMMHRFSSLVKSPGSSSKTPFIPFIAEENDDDRSTSTIIHSEPLPAPTLKIKRVDSYFSRWSKTWTYRVKIL